MFTDVVYIEPRRDPIDPECVDQDWLDLMVWTWEPIRMYGGFLYGRWKSNNTKIGES